MITVKANARSASYDSDDLITSGSAGIPCEFVLSSDFNGLSPIAVFEGSGTARDVALIGNTCVVPHEVVATAGGYLRIGIYASNADGTIVIPTVWAGSKMILQGTEPSEVDPSEPTPSWVAQVQEAAAEALANSEEAIEIAGGAEAAAEEARQSASDAAASATAAGQSASAAGTAQTAAEAAQTAAASASDAAVAARGSAENSAQAAAGSATAAAGSAEAAAASEAAAREVQESIPVDYTALSEDVSELKSQMGEKAPAIIAETDKAFGHSSIESALAIDFYGNELAFRTCKYCACKNYMVKKTGNRTLYDATLNWANGFFVINGTSTSTGDTSVYNDSCSMPAGNYKVIVEVNPNSTQLPFAKAWYLYLTHTDDTVQTITVSIKTDDVTVDFTTEKAVKKIAVAPGVRNVNYDNYTVWIGIIPDDATIIDTGLNVENGSSVEYLITGDFDEIDTLQHESVVRYVADTKEYIDNHIPDDMLTESDLIYITPEMFGAVGDGTTDDAVAIASCLAAARVNSSVFTPVRGFGRYKVSNSVVISGDYVDVYLHHIIYSGSDAAIKISGNHNKYRFDYVNATTINTAVGIQIDATGTEGFSSGELSCGYIISNSHAVYVASTAPNVISYNIFRFKYMRSVYGDIFRFNVQFQCNENDFYGKYVFARSGYFAYATDNSIMPGATFHQFCIEEDVKYGIKNTSVNLLDCRTDEFMGQAVDSSDPKKGVLFDFDGRISSGCYSDDLTPINFNTIDVSGAKSFDEVLQDVTDEYAALPPDASSADKFYILVKLCLSVSRFKRLNGLRPNTIFAVPSGKIITYFNKKVIKLDGDMYYKPTSSTFDTTDINPTFVDVSESSASVVSVYLNDNYCWLGINRFNVKQTASIKAKVYDKNNNLIFDGTNNNDGVYEFECEFERLPQLTLNLPGGDTYNVPDIYVNKIYTGNNEVWHIYKKDEIQPV